MNSLDTRADFTASHRQDLYENGLDVYKTLLESTNAIPWKVDWASMQFAYIGPQIETLLGWDQGSWKSIDDWVARMHPDDRDYAVNTCVSQSKAGLDHEVDYRALTKDGDYVWIRDVVHVVRTPSGEVDCLIGFMFDISARKRTEDELFRLQKELELLSLTDGLTGIANRRMFDQRLDAEWKHSHRSQKPLSLVILDIDYFKQYNDAYGHISGDECLKMLASVLTSVAQRPRDVIARFGGEEFIMILPETDSAAAHGLAQQCVQRIAELRITHDRSEAGPYVTASVGVGTTIAAQDVSPRSFIEAVDRSLYAAKRKGRNRIEAVAA